MTFSDLQAMERALRDMQAWDGDGQLQDHGASGARNDKIRATARTIRGQWLSMGADTGWKLVHSLSAGA